MVRRRRPSADARHDDRRSSEPMLAWISSRMVPTRRRRMAMADACRELGSGAKWPSVAPKDAVPSHGPIVAGLISRRTRLRDLASPRHRGSRFGRDPREAATGGRASSGRMAVLRIQGGPGPSGAVSGTAFWCVAKTFPVSAYERGKAPSSRRSSRVGQELETTYTNRLPVAKDRWAVPTDVSSRTRGLRDSRSSCGRSKTAAAVRAGRRT